MFFRPEGDGFAGGRPRFDIEPGFTDDIYSGFLPITLKIRSSDVRRCCRSSMKSGSNAAGKATMRRIPLMAT